MYACRVQRYRECPIHPTCRPDWIMPEIDSSTNLKPVKKLIKINNSLNLPSGFQGEKSFDFWIEEYLKTD